MTISDDIEQSVANGAIELIMEGTSKPQYIGGGRWVWSREALEAEIVHAIEEFRTRAKAYLESCAKDCRDYSGSDLSFGQQQGYERAADALGDVPARVDGWLYDVQ